jgi:iron complex outermembrane recepter protein
MENYFISRNIYAACIGLLISSYALDVRAEDQAAPNQPTESLPSVDVNTKTNEHGSAVPDNIPNIVEGMSAQQIVTQVNAMTSGETIKYLPSIDVRERDIGDRNGIIATRTTGTVSGAESLLYSDSLLLSNLLGNSYSYPPQWGMVSTQEIDHIDMIYGPFSAQYPGNSMGGVVTITTKMPEKFEFHSSIKGALETFSLYGTNTDLPTFNGNFAVGNKINSLSFWLTYDRLDNHGHPLNFATLAPFTACTSSCGSPTTVTGGYHDVNNLGQSRFVYGANSMDHSVQNMGKLKLGYDFAPAITGTYTLGVWGLKSDVAARTYLTDSSGNPVYSGNVNINGTTYKLSANNPSHAEATHLMQGIDLKSTTKGVFDFELSGSSFNYLRDRSLAPTTYNGTTTTSGKDTQLDGTGWYTADAKGIFRPQEDILGKHEVSFGTHYDIYTLNSFSYATTNWLAGNDGSVNGISEGKTQTKAIYIEDVWSFLPKWKLTLGGRQEYWSAFNGYNFGGSPYAGRNEDAFSPKTSLSYQATSELELRASYGQATRFPTVTELFQKTANANGSVTGDPGLHSEKVNSYDLSAIYTLNKTTMRVSAFQENLHNGIYSQTDTNNNTLYENVTRAKIYGVETAVQSKDVLVDGFDLQGSLTWAASKIEQDALAPNYAGGQVPRIPEWRAKLVGTYSPTDKWSISAGIRYSSASYGNLDNSDWNHNVFGGISSYLVADVRATYKLDKNWTLAAGIDNIGDYKYYVNPHPYPDRTYLVELRYDY